MPLWKEFCIILGMNMPEAYSAKALEKRKLSFILCRRASMASKHYSLYTATVWFTFRISSSNLPWDTKREEDGNGVSFLHWRLFYNNGAAKHQRNTPVIFTAKNYVLESWNCAPTPCTFWHKPGHARAIDHSHTEMLYPTWNYVEISEAVKRDNCGRTLSSSMRKGISFMLWVEVCFNRGSKNLKGYISVPQELLVFSSTNKESTLKEK